MRKKEKERERDEKVKCTRKINMFRNEVLQLVVVVVMMVRCKTTVYI